MALTPEDVVNKRFQPTKFREGYDQDEVDDFLDEVVVELRRLNQENEELRQRLIASDARMGDMQRSAAQTPPAPAFAAPAFAAPPPPSSPAGQFEAPAPPAPAFTAPAADPNTDPNNTNNLLQLARRLHEEHVREGVAKRDALIAEGQATADRLVSEAQTAQRQHIGSLDQERLQLEKQVDELRTFEREYRQKLKGYIEGQLRELDDSNVMVASGAQAPDAAHTTGPVMAGTGPIVQDTGPQTYDMPSAQQPPAPTFTGFGGSN
ncbi:MAG: DivIVA domain-containing protein [Microbacteriaceae bacterium]